MYLHSVDVSMKYCLHSFGVICLCKVNVDLKKTMEKVGVDYSQK